MIVEDKDGSKWQAPGGKAEDLFIQMKEAFQAGMRYAVLVSDSEPTIAGYCVTTDQVDFMVFAIRAAMKEAPNLTDLEIRISDLAAGKEIADAIEEDLKYREELRKHKFAGAKH